MHGPHQGTDALLLLSERPWALTNEGASSQATCAKRCRQPAHSEGSTCWTGTCHITVGEH